MELYLKKHLNWVHGAKILKSEFWQMLDNAITKILWIFFSNDPQ